MARWAGRTRWIAVTVVAVIALCGCRPFGAGTPVCGDLELNLAGDSVRATVTEPSGEVHHLRASQLIQMQAVPTAEWGPCIVELPRGWDLILPEPRSGEVELQLYASGLGGVFLSVTLREECEPTADARRTDAPFDTAERWVDVRDRSRGMSVAIVPVAARHEQAAYQLATDLSERELRGSRLRVSLSNVVHGPAEERIDRQLEDGVAVIVVDDDLSLRDELELRLPGVVGPINGSFGTLLTELADRTEAPRYEASWWDIAEGGCIEYSFAADGPDAGSVAEDVDDAIGRFPLGELRRGYLDHGHDIEPPP